MPLLLASGLAKADFPGERPDVPMVERELANLEKSPPSGDAYAVLFMADTVGTVKTPNAEWLLRTYHRLLKTADKNLQAELRARVTPLESFKNALTGPPTAARTLISSTLEQITNSSADGGKSRGLVIVALLASERLFGAVKNTTERDWLNRIQLRRLFHRDSEWEVVKNFTDKFPQSPAAKKWRTALAEFKAGDYRPASAHPYLKL